MDWYQTSSKMWSDAIRGVGEGQADPWGLYRQWLESMEEARGRISGSTNGFPGGFDGMTEATRKAQANAQAMMGPMTSAMSPEKMREQIEATMKSWQKSAGLGIDMMSMAPRWTEMIEQAQESLMNADPDVLVDPLQSITQFYNATSGPISEFVKDILEQEEFLEPSSRFLQNYARLYGIFRQRSEEYLNLLQLPTRSDVSRVASLVISLEDKVDRIEEAFEDFEYGYTEPATAGELKTIENRIDRLDRKLDAGGGSTGDYATAGSVSGLEERVDRVEGKLDRLIESVEKLGAAPSGNARSETANASDQSQETQATEAARRKAQELGVDLAQVDGTGSNGQITVGDVREKGAS